MSSSPPLFPIGSPPTAADSTDHWRDESISGISRLPVQLRELLAPVAGNQLDLRYRNWTVRQIVHHIADSHVNAYIRFKWTLTEDTPLIKAYDEGLWSELPESRSGAIEPSLHLIEGLHERWTQLLRSMSDSDFEKCFVHPETGDNMALSFVVRYYAWHGIHHMGQIEWLLQQKDR